jgi:hypothetical protein
VKEFDSGLQDLNDALKLDPENKSVKSAIVSLQSTKKKDQEAEKKRYQNLFK